MKIFDIEYFASTLTISLYNTIIRAKTRERGGENVQFYSDA